MRHICLVVLLIAGAAGVRAQQASPSATAPTIEIRGRVVAENDAPLARVRVAVAGNPEAIVVLSAARGEFVLPVPRNTTSVRLNFAKAGFAGETFELTRDELLQRVNDEWVVRLARGAAITGQVVDNAGETVTGAPVIVRRFREAGDPPSTDHILDTSDLGEFRLGGLRAGRYLVTAGSPRSTPADLKNALAPENLAVGAVVSAGTPGIQSVTLSEGQEARIAFTVDLPSELTQLAGGRRPDPDPDASGIIRGRVTTPTGRGVPRAVVRAIRSGASIRAVETDAQGRFTIADVLPGDYRVEARKTGYVTREYGQEMELQTGTTVLVGNDAVAEGIDITLARGGAITGTIVDEAGDPLQGVRIDVLQLQFVQGRMRAVRIPSARERFTDDLGRYRLFGFLPGAYLVRAQIEATLPNAAAQAYLPMFYPGVTNIALAAPVRLALTGETSGVDFTFAPSPAVSVTGTVVDSLGRPIPWAALTLTVSERSGGMQVEPGKLVAAPDGTFVFAHVAPGDYVVQASNGNRPEGQEFGAAYVTVADRDPAPLTLRTSPHPTVKVRLLLDGAEPPPGAALTMSAPPTDFDRAPVAGVPTNFERAPDGSFEMTRAWGPRLFRLHAADPSWYLKSVVIKGEDVVDRAFDFGSGGATFDVEALVATQGATVVGRVTDDRGAVVTSYATVVFSRDTATWFAGSRWLKMTRPMHDGTFRVQGLPPGDYWIAAVNRLDGTAGAGEWQDPAVLDALAGRAVRVTLGEAQTQTLTLRVVNR